MDFACAIGHQKGRCGVSHDVRYWKDASGMEGFVAAHISRYGVRSGMSFVCVCHKLRPLAD